MLKKAFYISLLATGLCTFPAQAFEVKSVSVGAPTIAHLCKQLGGKGADPIITIKHDPVAGERIKVRMYDVLTGPGRGLFEHRKKSIKSDASGTTILKANFLPPCNTTNGRKNSSYRFDIKVKGGKPVTKKWFKFNSKTKKISR